jgi:hypothetical protein
MNCQWSIANHETGIPKTRNGALKAPRRLQTAVLAKTVAGVVQIFYLGIDTGVIAAPLSLRTAGTQERKIVSGTRFCLVLGWRSFLPSCIPQRCLIDLE